MYRIGYLLYFLLEGDKKNIDKGLCECTSDASNPRSLQRLEEVDDTHDTREIDRKERKDENTTETTADTANPANDDWIDEV